MMTVRGFKGIAAGQMTMKKLVEAGLDGTTTTCTFAHYDETEELYELVRDHHLHIDLNVMDVEPRVGPGFYPIDLWTESQKSETLFRHEQLKYAARVWVLLRIR
jgi:hypothetical protein